MKKEATRDLLRWMCNRDPCEVAIKDESLRLAGRVKSSPGELELFAQSLAPDDQVALVALPASHWRVTG